MAVDSEVRENMRQSINRPGSEDQIKTRLAARLRRMDESEARLRDLMGRDGTTKTAAKGMEATIEEYEAEREAILARFPDLEPAAPGEPEEG